MPEPIGRNSSRQTLAICAGLAVMIIAVFGQAARFDFVRFDDNYFIYEDPHILRGLTPDNVRWALTTAGSGNYIPLTRMTWMASVSLFGPSPHAMHVENVVIHVINTWLVFFVLMAATRGRWRSAVVAAVFAVHPTRIESVVWLSERKDVLSTLFALASLLCYVHWTRASGRARSVALYVGTVTCFALAMLAKQMLTTLPCVMILLDYWPLGRAARGIGRLVVEKIPLLAITAAAVLASYFSARYLIEDSTPTPIGFRLANACISYAEYLREAVWPWRLSFFYPYRQNWTYGALAVSVVLLGCISAVAAYFRRSKPQLLIGWLWFLGVLFPSVGLVELGPQSIADRWLYVPLIGLSVMVTWGVAGNPRDGSPTAQRAGAVVACLLIGAFAVSSYQQTRFWKDTDTLYARGYEVLNSAPDAHMQMAHRALERGDRATALAEYTLAAQLAPQDYHPEYNLGNLLLATPQEAVPHYQRALQLNPHHAPTKNNLAIAYLRLDRPDKAFDLLQSAVADDPDYADAHANLGSLLLDAGNPTAAEREFKTALQLEPRNEVALSGLKRLQSAGR